ncbi:MAG TPA: hypothetical protein PLK99_09600 [Burkholderiales bacterium]|nr:hypothetical protein [Burkholderiales bacterium]
MEVLVKTTADGRKLTVKGCALYLDEEQAISALARDPLFDQKDGFYARMALREQLISMDAMEEDI